MAGDWIKMRGNLWDDPRVSRICDLTDSGEAAVVGGLYWLWATADQHSEDGFMDGLTVRQIDRKTGLAGFGQALVAVGWIEEIPNGIRITRFEEHNGASAKKRCQTAKRVANFKSGNAEVTPAALPEEQTSVSNALPREEKRREEKNNSLPTVESKARKRATQPQALTVDSLVAEGVQQQHAADWLAVRKAKSMPLTATALNETRKEAEKAGVSLDEAVRISASQSWAGFRASWMARQDDFAGSPRVIPIVGKQAALEAHNAEVGRRWLASQQAEREAQA